VTKPTKFPPDAALLSLARTINSRLTEGSVNFYLIENPDGSRQTGMIFQCGPHRAAVTTSGFLGEADADEIVQSVSRWVARLAPESKWTTDINEAS
jgi:hypothetical protein